MKSIVIAFGLFSLFFKENVGCRTDHINVKYYHAMNLEPMDSWTLLSTIKEEFGK